MGASRCRSRPRRTRCRPDAVRPTQRGQSFLEFLWAQGILPQRHQYPCVIPGTHSPTMPHHHYHCGDSDHQHNHPHRGQQRGLLFGDMRRPWRYDQRCSPDHDHHRHRIRSTSAPSTPSCHMRAPLSATRLDTVGTRPHHRSVTPPTDIRDTECGGIQSIRSGTDVHVVFGSVYGVGWLRMRAVLRACSRRGSSRVAVAFRLAGGCGRSTPRRIRRCRGWPLSAESVPQGIGPTCVIHERAERRAAASRELTLFDTAA